MRRVNGLVSILAFAGVLGSIDDSIAQSNSQKAGNIATGSVPFTPRSTDSVQSWLKPYIDKATLDAVFLVGAKGGYIFRYEDVLPMRPYPIAYNEVGKPSRQFMENEMSRFVAESLRKTIPTRGGKLVFNRMGVTTSINEDHILIELRNPITMRRSNSESVYSVKINLPLGYMLSVRDDIIEKDSDVVDFARFQTYNVGVTLYFISDEILAYKLEQPIEGSDSFEYIFALKNQPNPLSGQRFMVEP